MIIDRAQREANAATLVERKTRFVVLFATMTAAQRIL